MLIKGVRRKSKLNYLPQTCPRFGTTSSTFLSLLWLSLQSWLQTNASTTEGGKELQKSSLKGPQVAMKDSDPMKMFES